MLFKTVYGPELESIFLWLLRFGPAPSERIFEAFTAVVEGQVSSTYNIEDALAFLESARMIELKNSKWHVSLTGLPTGEFELALCFKLRSIQLERDYSYSSLDPYFLGCVEELFILPDTLFHSHLHRDINNLNIPQPCSTEKVNAWRRVLEFLGIGVRGYGGLMVQYSSKLVGQIIDKWEFNEGSMQKFLEGHFDKYLPWKTAKGEIAKALVRPLTTLESMNIIKLQPKQDLPSKSYMDDRQIKWICKERRYENTMH